jgi:dihydroflavonol-4-reductase
MVKALVTGGTGFVGSHVVRALLEAGHSVRVLHRTTSKLDALDGLTYESAIGDLNDPAALRAACVGCAWAFHVAAVSDYWRSDKARLFAANVDGTRHVLAAAREAGVDRVVFTSSGASIGVLPGDAAADETVAFNLPPDDFPYAYSKHLAEGVVADAVAAGQDVVTVNPVVVMGPGDLNMISGSFIAQIKRLGRWVPVTSGGVGVTDVRDVARWHVAAAEKGVTGERYILGTANYDYKTWFALIADVVGSGRPFLTLPDFVAPVVATGIGLLRRIGIPTPVDASQARMGVRKVYFDCSKAHAAFDPPQIDMRRSLEDTYAWYRENGFV